MRAESTDHSTPHLTQLAESVMTACDRVATFTDAPGEITRLFLSPATKRLQAWLLDYMRQAGLESRIDAVGNVVGHYAAANETAENAGRVLLVGSHLDTVVNAGRYDGVLGVMLGIAAVESLEGERLPFAIDVVGFSEEEGVRFGTPYLGSAAIAGCFDGEWLELTDGQGVRLADAITEFGLEASAIEAAAYDPERVVGFLECHIEQGPVLLQQNLPVAVVSGIAGQSRLRLRMQGTAGHAGTLPMDARSDALAAAAALIVAAETIGHRTPGLRVTVGKIEVEPNLRNVVPGEAVLAVDIRHPDDIQRRLAVESVLHEAREAADARGVKFTCEAIDDQPAIGCDPNLVGHLTKAIKVAGYPFGVTYSGAGHDAVIMSKFCPTAMLFVRHPGVSHHPSESVDIKDVAVALDVLRRTILNLASTEP
jgi:allantoate deiminase